MPAGRCAGCGQTDASLKKMSAHIAECEDYKALYRSDPDRALSPAEEQRRWVTEDGATRAKLAQQDARAQRAETHREMNDRKLSDEHARWETPTSHLSTSRPATTPDEGSSWSVRRGEVDPESLVDLGKRVATWRFNRVV